MKTKIISKLKKQLLIIELAKGSYPEVTPRLLAINNSDGSIKIFRGSYTLLGSPDEIKEDDAEKLVEILWNGFRNYSEDGSVGNYQRLVCKTAIESFNSALESEISWENPLGEKLNPLWGDKNFTHDKSKAWHQAQEKTFDRNRVKIFFKN